jgi:hypothetical protein
MLIIHRGGTLQSCRIIDKFLSSSDMLQWFEKNFVNDGVYTNHQVMVVIKA